MKGSDVRPLMPRSGHHDERVLENDVVHTHRVAERRSKQNNRFVAAMLTVALLLFVSVLVYHGGGRTETARQIGAGFKWAAYILAVITGLLRWKGPWREPQD